MKNNKSKQFQTLSLLSAILLLAPMVSSAQLAVDSGLYSNTNTKNTGVKADVDIKVYDVYDDSNVDGDVESKTETNSDTSLKVNTSGVAVTSSGQVSSDADLEAFSANMALTKDGVAKVMVSPSGEADSQVIVAYKHHGKFLGFIPATIRSTTIVKADANGNVAVMSNPSWWSFLVAKKNYAKAELESRLKNNAAIKANMKADASASAKARVAEAVIAELEAHAATQASVNN